MASLHYFGIRHHGPGSSRRLCAALDALQPTQLLIEGPADLTPLLPMLAHPDMKLPVALMSFATEHQGASIFYPFAEFSPEYQAVCWAVRHSIPVRFIDIPVAHQLAEYIARDQAQTSEDEESAPQQEARTQPSELEQDPMSVLARLAGYTDSESWWNQVLEQSNKDEPDLFQTIANTMHALRQAKGEESRETLQREAFMRLEIAEVAKTEAGPIAIVCGAWHVPALMESHTKKADKGVIADLATKLSPKHYSSTWIPWTTQRLAFSSGYGAGVTAPQWYLHLWHKGNDESSLIHWLSTIAHALREQGAMVSTASVIEATKLCHALAMVRQRPHAGFEEARDASIAALCFGNHLLWNQIETNLLLGNTVGEVPAEVPMAPILVDLQQAQKQTRLKPTALPAELALDLRTDAGLSKSMLLRRLQLLDVHWGKQIDAGGSRGTFRERWKLQWDPEFAVCLVEKQIYGTTITQAASAYTRERMQTEKRLASLAELVLSTLEAHIPECADFGIVRLAERATQSSECIELLDALPPLIEITRYGTSRAMSLTHLSELVEQLATQAALALPIAVRNLNEEESQRFQNAINAGHKQLELAECSNAVMETWWQALEEISFNDSCDSGARGVATRLLHQSKRLDQGETQTLMQRLLSPALPLDQTKGFFAGFFFNASEQLLYDHELRQLTNQWLMSLDEQNFIETLPVVRRIFSSLDAMERRRLLDAATQGIASRTAITATPYYLELLPESVSRLQRLLQGEAQWMN